MSFCEHCVQGVTHEGTAKGEIVKIGGIDCYVATPTIDYPKDKAILYLPDVYGLQLINAKLMADDFAANGFKTIIPDYLNGDPAIDAPGFDIMKWFGSHTNEFTRPPLDKVIAGLKEQGVVSFGATGYCFGGRYVFDLAFENIIKVSVANHPSLLSIPADLEKYKASSKAALLINSCEIDGQFPLEASAQADELFGGEKFSPGYKREYFAGCTHGFAIRGDLSNAKVKAGKEGAFKAAVEWFIAKL
jgi:dienelactone hydrolase